MEPVREPDVFSMLWVQLAWVTEKATVACSRVESVLTESCIWEVITPLVGWHWGKKCVSVFHGSHLERDCWPGTVLTGPQGNPQGAVFM